jgi:hypothetical protein
LVTRAGTGLLATMVSECKLAASFYHRFAGVRSGIQLNPKIAA